MRKFLRISIVVLIITLIVICIYFLKNVYIVENSNNNFYNEDTEENYIGRWSPEFFEVYYGLTNLTGEEIDMLRYYYDNEYEFILKMMVPNQNWRLFPIEKELREKLHNEVKEVVTYNFDNIEYSPETLSDIVNYGSVGQIQIIGTKGKKKIMFTFQISMNHGLRELTLLKKQVIQDEKGNEVDNRLIFDDKNWEDAIDILSSRPYDENIKQVAVTDNFLSKYNSLYDAFVKIIKPEKVSDYIGFAGNDFLNNRTVDYTWWNNGEERTYRVKFILDDKSYIDDVEITPLD